jgi:hypothetical protein
LDALSTLISHTPDVQQPVLLRKLESTLEYLVNLERTQVPDGIPERQVSQSELLPVVGGLSLRLRTSILPLANKIFTLIHSVLGSSEPEVHEEVLLCLDNIVTALGSFFFEFLPHFEPYLLFQLKQFDVVEVIKYSLNIISRLPCSSPKSFAPFLPKYASCVIECLNNPAFPAEAHSYAVLLLGEMGLYCGVDFLPFIRPVMELCFKVLQMTKVGVNSLDRVEYIDDLMKSVFFTYSNLINGLRDKKDELSGYLVYVIPQVSLIIGNDRAYRESVQLMGGGGASDMPLAMRDGLVEAILEFLSDIMNTYGLVGRENLNKPVFLDFIMWAVRHPSEGVASRGKALKEILKNFNVKFPNA